MNPERRRIPVTIVTGFLGSGKTTLLRHVLAQPGAERICVIVNEFGDIGLDHELLEASDDDVILLAKGCLCCTIRGSLGDTLRDILTRQQAGRLGVFDRVMIETSGLADPTPILQLLASDAYLVERYTAEKVVTVVDGVSGMANLDAHPEAQAQVVVADLALISKEDLASPAATALLRSRIGHLAAGAEIDTMTGGEIYSARLFGPPRPRAEVSVHNHHAHAHEVVEPVDSSHTGRFDSFVVHFDRPLAEAEFAGLVTVLQQLYGPRLLRVKGIVRVAGRTAPVIVQGAGGTLYPHAAWTCDPPRPVPSCLVFIVAGSLRNEVERLLRPLGGKVLVPSLP